jgi:hypothetical protein
MIEALTPFCARSEFHRRGFECIDEIPSEADHAGVFFFSSSRARIDSSDAVLHGRSSGFQNGAKA